MKNIVADTKLIAYCGLYCGACGKYLNEKCPGCLKNEKASWCKVRACCMEHSYSTCADCQIKADLADCKEYNSFMAKLFGFIFRSDRAACIKLIQEKGLEDYATYMAENRIQSIRK
jgi:hypothetical protein